MNLTGCRLLRRGARWGLALVLLVLASGPAPRAAEPLVSLDAEDAYLPSVLRILAEKGGLNIITGTGVTAERISIHMRDVPIDQAVNLVVRAAGLAYERIGNSILVAEPRVLKEETGLSSYVIELKFADALDVQTALGKLSAEIEVDRGGNRLIVVTSPRVIAEIEEIVRVMDVPARQVMLETRVIEVSLDDVKELGIDWNLLTRQGVIIVEGRPDPSDDSPSGRYTSPPGQLPSDVPFVNLAPRRDEFFRQAKTFEVALDMLISEGNARVLASPKIATLNGREASILVGERIPFVISGTAFAGGGAAPVQRIEKEEVGIKLRITPLINADGYITTEITPEVSQVIAFRGENGDLPQIRTRQATTTVRLKDGNTVIIGGLLSDERVSTVSKLPILGQIPVIGYLFQHHRIVTSKKDLVIEVTPRILPDQG